MEKQYLWKVKYLSETVVSSPKSKTQSIQIVTKTNSYADVEKTAIEVLKEKTKNETYVFKNILNIKSPKEVYTSSQN